MTNETKTTAALDNEECFVIMPIADQEGYEPGHFGRVFEDLIFDAVQKAGFVPMRADKITRANNIHVDILNRLRKAPIAICDISARNPNVFFELAFRQAFDMPTVILKDERTQSPFDIISIRYVDYDSRLRYRDVVAKREEITRFISDTVEDPRNSSLISLLSIGEKATVLESKSSPEMAAIGILSKKIDAMKYEVEEFLKTKISSISSIYENDRSIRNLDSYRGDLERAFIFKTNARSRRIIDEIEKIKNDGNDESDPGA